MVSCPNCQSQNVFITRAEPREYFDPTRENGPDPLRPDHHPPPGQTTRTMRPAAPTPVVWSFLPAQATCRDCGSRFTHAAADCPPATELVALIANQVANGTYPAGLRDGTRLKDAVFWNDEASKVTPADKYKMLYNMHTLARFGFPFTPNPPTK